MNPVTFQQKLIFPLLNNMFFFPQLALKKVNAMTYPYPRISTAPNLSPLQHYVICQSAGFECGWLCSWTSCSTANNQSINDGCSMRIWCQCVPNEKLDRLSIHVAVVEWFRVYLKDLASLLRPQANSWRRLYVCTVGKLLTSILFQMSV